MSTTYVGLPVLGCELFHDVPDMDVSGAGMELV